MAIAGVGRVKRDVWVSFGKVCDFTERSMGMVRSAAARGDFGKALSVDGRKINVTHADAEKWMGRPYEYTRGAVGRRKKSAQEQADEALNPHEPQPAINDVSDEIMISRVTNAIILLTELGTPSQIHQWAKVRKEIAAAATAEARRDQATGQLVPRSLVERAVFGYLDALNRRFLEDISATIVQRIGKGTPTERLLVEDLFGALIKKAQEDCVRLIGATEE